MSIKLDIIANNLFINFVINQISKALVIVKATRTLFFKKKGQKD